MDMKKILQALDGASSKPVEGSNDMKKFLSIVKGIPSIGEVQKESVIASFEEDTIGGDANKFLIGADEINDLVMDKIDTIKINADEELLKDLMDKFNSFMSAYHAVGKEILQPDMFKENVEDLGNGVRKKTNPDGSYSVSDGSGTKHYDAQGKLTKTDSPRFAGVQKSTSTDGSTSTSYQQGPLSVKQDKDAAGNTTSTDAEYQLGAAKLQQKKTTQGTQNKVAFKEYFDMMEAKKMKAKDDPCWKGYKMVGTKKKGGKEVPNCVPGKKGD